MFKRRETRGAPQGRALHFRNVNRITLLPVVFANGDAGRLLFITQGAALPYQIVILPNGKLFVEPINSCLPTGSLHTMRKELDGVDMKILSVGLSRSYRISKALPAVGERFCSYTTERSHMGIKVL